LVVARTETIPIEKLKKVVDKDSDEMVKWAMNEDLRNWRK